MNPINRPPTTPSTTPSTKRSERSDDEESQVKRQKTGSSAFQSDAASDVPRPLDIPRPVTPPQTALPSLERHAANPVSPIDADTLNIANEANSTADVDVEMPTAMDQDAAGIEDTRAAEGNVPTSNIEVPPGTLVIALPPIPEPTMAPHEIISINPHPWDLNWIMPAFDLVLRPGNALSVETKTVLRTRAKPMMHLTLLHRWTYERYRKELAAMRWAFQLGKLRPYANMRLPEYSIQILLDTDAYQPNLPQAPAHHTLALMVAGWQDMQTLYRQLCERAGNPGAKPAHMDLDRLPIYALLAARLMLDPNEEEFEVVLAQILKTLSSFGDDIQARVHAELCAFFFEADPTLSGNHEQALSKLGTQASKEQLEKINRFKAVAAPFFAGQACSQALVGDLFGMLPADGQPWNLMALVAMQILSGLHEGKVLMPGQIHAFVNKAKEMVSYIMSLEVGATRDHPLNFAIAPLNHLAIVDCFLQLSLREQMKFLQVLGTDQVGFFSQALFTRLSPDDVVHFCDALLNQTEEPISSTVYGFLHELKFRATTPR